MASEERKATFKLLLSSNLIFMTKKEAISICNHYISSYVKLKNKFKQPGYKLTNAEQSVMKLLKEMKRLTNATDDL